MIPCYLLFGRFSIRARAMPFILHSCIMGRGFGGRAMDVLRLGIKQVPEALARTTVRLSGEGKKDRANREARAV